MTHQDIRHLATLASQATAALLPLSADPEGRDSHGGRLANRAEVIGRALDTLERAGRLAGRIRRGTGHPGEAVNPHPEGIV